MGTGARLREEWPGRAGRRGEPLPGDPVMGLRSLEDGYVPPILDVSKLDRKLLVSNAEAAAAARALLEREGLFAGVSSGAVVHVARRVAEELPKARSSSPCWPTAAGSICRRRSGPARRSTRACSGGDPAGGSCRAPGPRGRGGAERVLRRARAPRRRRRPVRPRPEHAWPRRTGTSSRSIRPSGSSRTRATSWPSSIRTRRRRRIPSRTDRELAGLWSAARS